MSPTSALVGLLALGVLAVGALAVVVRRVAGRKPGSSPRRALPVADFHQLDAEVSRVRCRCGGRVRNEAEGPGATPRQRFVLAVCHRCSAEHRLWFELE